MKPQLLLILMLALFALPTSAGTPKAHLVKVAFLYNFTKFVEWPNEGRDLTICVDASQEFMEAAKAIEKRSGSRQRFNVLLKPKDLSHCHIIYMPSVRLSAEALVNKHGQKIPALTVGDSEEFVSGQGGMVGFVLINNKIKLVINLAAVQRSGLQMSSQLLEVAHKVIQGK